MPKQSTARLKVNPPLGNLPALQWALVSQLQVDAEYQRSVDNGPSQALIRKIATHWNWDLCQPLVVSRRADGSLFVIDGQHRWEAARMRGDINQLPCVVVDYASAADEAASFVHLNQQRKPLSKIDVFKAAVASEDPEACAILRAMEAAGLSVAPHGNFVSWKPGMVSNIGGIMAQWRRIGAGHASTALAILGKAFSGQVLQYAGTLFPGICAVVADDLVDADRDRFVALLASRTQADWRKLIMRHRGEYPDLKYGTASAEVLRREWAEEARKFDRSAVADGSAWCDQCDMRVTREQAEGCKSRHCSLHPKAAQAA